MALAMLFMMSGGVSIHADEVSAETTAYSTGEGSTCGITGHNGIENADATLKTEADGKLT